LLAKELSDLLGTVVDLYLRAHGYHWNVEGEDFAQYHALFEAIYSDVYESIDPIAENVRKLGEFAPFKLDTLRSSSVLEETRVAPRAKDMAKDLLVANEQAVSELKRIFRIANDADEQGIANFLAERIDMHQKWSWQLSASTK